MCFLPHLPCTSWFGVCPLWPVVDSCRAENLCQWPWPWKGCWLSPLREPLWEWEGPHLCSMVVAVAVVISGQGAARGVGWGRWAAFGDDWKNTDLVWGDGGAPRLVCGAGGGVSLRNRLYWGAGRQVAQWEFSQGLSFRFWYYSKWDSQFRDRVRVTGLKTACHIT